MGQSDELFLRAGFAGDTRPPGPEFGGDIVLHDITDVFSDATLVAFTQGIRPGLYDELDDPPVGAIIESANDGHLYWVHRDGNVHLLCDSGGYGGAAVWGSITGVLADQTDLDAALDALAAGIAGKQPLDSELSAIAALSSAADKGIQFVGAGVAGLFDLTAAAKTVLDDPTVGAMVDTLGGAASTGTGGLVRTTSPALAGTPTAPTASGGTNTTQIATTAFVSAAVSSAVSGLLDLKGDLACAANPNYPAGSVGDLYYVSTAGKIGGASGKTVEIGDAIVCKVDNAGGTEAAVGTSWFVLEKSLNGALLSANNLSDVANAATARTNLGLAIGSNVQAFSANLQSISSISFVADQSLYWNGTAFFPYSVTSAARTVLDDTTVAAMVDTLGGAASTGSGGLARATSPAFAGTPTAPTAAGGTSTTQIATTAFVGAAVSGLGALIAANNLSDLANATTARSNLGVAIGSQVQAYHANLAALAGIAGVADLGFNFSGAGTLATYTITAAAKTVLDDTTVAAMVNTLGGATSSGSGGLVRITSPALLGTPTAPTAAGGTNTTQIATTAFVLSEISTAVSGLLDLKGDLDCSLNPNYPAGSVGDLYYVTGAGRVGGASGKFVDIGDAVVCKTNNAGGAEATVGTSWFVLEKNLNGALLSSNNLSDVASASTARSNLGLAIGSNVQAYHANLAALAGIAGVADLAFYFSGSGALSTFTLSAAARTVLDDANVAAMVNTLGGVASTGSDGLVRYTSPSLLGTPTAPTAAVGTDTNQIANTSFVRNEIEATVIDVVPSPGQAPSRYWLPYHSMVVTTTTLVAGELRYLPFQVVGVGYIMTKIGVNVTTAHASSIRLGIYSAGTGGAIGTPSGAPLLDAGTVSASTTGIKEITISQALDPGWYWLAILSEGTPTITADDLTNAVIVGGLGTLAANGGPVTELKTTGVAWAALPNTGSFTRLSTAIIPRVFLRRGV